MTRQQPCCTLLYRTRRAPNRPILAQRVHRSSRPNRSHAQAPRRTAHARRALPPSATRAEWTVAPRVRLSRAPWYQGARAIGWEMKLSRGWPGGRIASRRVQGRRDASAVKRLCIPRVAGCTVNLGSGRIFAPCPCAAKLAPGPPMGALRGMARHPGFLQRNRASLPCFAVNEFRATPTT